MESTMLRSTTVTAARLSSTATAGMILGLCLGFASCGDAPVDNEEEEGAAALVDDKELCRNKCTKDNCSALCKLDDGSGSQCTHHIPFCNGPNGFEDPKDPSSGQGPPGTGQPENWCANTNFRSCQDVDNWRLVRQYVKRECDPGPGGPGPGPGSAGRCRNAVYEVWSTERTATDCKSCSCRFVTQRRCVNGRLVGGDWGGAKPSCFSGGADRAVCN